MRNSGRPVHTGRHQAIVSDMEEPEEGLGRIIAEFVFGVAQYKAAARGYYYEVMLSNHSCPECGEKLRMMKRRSGVLQPRPSFGSYYDVPEKQVLRGQTCQA